MRKAFLIIALISLGAINFTSCSDDFDGVKKSSNTQNNLKTANPSQYGLVLYDETGVPYDCDYSKPGNCIPLTIINGVALNAMVDLSTSIDDGNCIDFITANRAVLDTIFGKEYLDRVISGELQISYNINNDTGVMYFLFTQDGTEVIVYPFGK